MNNFVFIPVTALFCYLLFLFAFLAARRTKLNDAFIMVLILGVLWVGGSFCMRMQFWPSEKLWYDVSLFGILMTPAAFFYFIEEFTGAKKSRLGNLWLLLSLALNVINICTGFFLAAPKAVRMPDGGVSFVYDVTWRVAILFLICAAVLLHMFLILFKSFRKDELRRRQLTPILLGIVSVFLGHACLCLPVFKGFPIDVLSAFVMICFMFYAMYRRRLFKLTLLVSRGSCYIVVAVLAVLLFSNAIGPLEHFIRAALGRYQDNYVLVTAVLFTIFTFLLYSAMKKFLDIVFIREEMTRAETLKEFSGKISSSLEIHQVLEMMATTIERTIKGVKVRIFIESADENSYDLAYCAGKEKPLVSFDKTSPLIGYLKAFNECVLMEEFCCRSVYKSIGEEEKARITDMDTAAFVPLTDGEALIGLIAISTGEHSRRLSYDDISFLNSVSSIGSIAVKNSGLYEKVYLEARTDDLTGLLNRKYFYQVLQREFDAIEDKPLALVILNLDDFKLYNQLYGIREGDLALKRVARIITDVVDCRGYTARYSGKEFAVILPGCDMTSAAELAEHVRRQVMDMNKSDKDYSLKVLTVSVGISACPEAGNVRELVESADMAVYQVKRHGKNAVMVSQDDKNSRKQDGDGTGGAYKQDVYSEYAPTVYALTAAIDTKDHYTFSHSKNVAYYASKLAEEINMGDDFVELIREAALLHDIGKIGIPESILNKPGKLTNEEYETMKSHVENSVGIIRYLPSLDYVIPAVIGHHERYDGNGYPRKISGEDIPLSARILCIADSFDAMVSTRSYKEPYTVKFALKELENQEGKQFDPKLAGLFIGLVENRKIVPRPNNELVFQKRTEKKPDVM